MSLISKINSNQFAATLHSRLLILLGSDASVLPTVSLPQYSEAVLSLALALEKEKHPARLLELFKRISFPGERIIAATAAQLARLGDHSNAEKLIKNVNPGLLTPAQRILYAEVRALSGDISAAEALIESAYADNQVLTDAYARVGWILYWEKKQYEKVIEWIEKDLAGQTADHLRSQESGVRSQESGVRSQESEVRSQKSGVRSQESGVRSQKSGVRNQKSNLDSKSLQFNSASGLQSTVVSLQSSPNSPRLSPRWRINYAQALAANGDIKAAGEQVAIAYAENAELQNGYARIGWQFYWPKREYAKVREWIEKDLAGQTADHLRSQESGVRSQESGVRSQESGVRSQESNLAPKSLQSAVCGLQSPSPSPRLSPQWLINYAMAVTKTENIEAALPIIEEAIKQDPEIKNPYSQLAWTHFIPEHQAYEKTLPYFEKDLSTGRLHGQQTINYALALSMVDRDDEAENLIEQAYSTDKTLKGGYSRVAYASHFIFKLNPPKAIEWFERDIQLGRDTPAMQIFHAAALAYAGDIESATKLVEQAYAHDEKCVNGFSLIGWYYHMAGNRQPEKAMGYFERDADLQRANSTNPLHVIAGLEAYQGDRKGAEDAVAENYEIAPGSIGRYTVIGFCDYARTHDFDYLLEMLKKDDALGKLSRPPHLRYIYGAVLLKNGEFARGKELIVESAQRSVLTEQYARSWLMRIGITGQALVNEFITPETQSIFASQCAAKA